jgi:2-keto-4-pentenoate hydratase/2-oxohepta-3-ene-1,7-dioic acid hydratase in catechol pathway
MKLCRFQGLELNARNLGHDTCEVHPQPRSGIIEQDLVSEIEGDLWGTRKRTGKKWRLREIKFLPPSSPSKIVCVGRNYLDHAKELGNEVPTEPLIFLKPPSSVIAPEEPIVLPPISQRVDHEGELAVVIGRRCFNLSPGESTQAYIAGYTCLNDVTARDIQKRDGQWTRGKGFDTFCPFGPVLETDFDFASATIETRVNKVVKQSAPLSEMIFSVDVIIRWIAQVMTLEPGDVIATGTPAGISPLASGDVVEVTVTGVGTLLNTVIAREK